MPDPEFSTDLKCLPPLFSPLTSSPQTHVIPTQITLSRSFPGNPTLPVLNASFGQYQDLIASIEEAADADLPGIGQEIQRRALGGELTRSQKAVAFETYFRAKTRILEKAEKYMKSDAQKTRKAILKAKTPQALARLGERMYKGQKESRGDISPREWTILWKEYNRRKKELAPGLPRGKRQIRRAQAAGSRIRLSITIRRAG